MDAPNEEPRPVLQTPNGEPRTVEHERTGNMTDSESKYTTETNVDTKSNNIGSETVPCRTSFDIGYSIGVVSERIDRMYRDMKRRNENGA